MSKSRDEGDIALILAGCWQVARAEAVLTWAQGDRETLFDTLSDDAISMSKWSPSKALDVLRSSRDQLETVKPETVAGACAMLQVISIMLADRSLDPNWTIAQGNILAMIVNIRERLGFLDEMTPLAGRIEG